AGVTLPSGSADSEEMFRKGSIFFLFFGTWLLLYCVYEYYGVYYLGSCCLLELNSMSLPLRTYRTNLGWSITRLAKEAGLARTAAKNAEIGHVIRADTAKAIADALSKALGREILVSDIEGLNIL